MMRGTLASGSKRPAAAATQGHRNKRERHEQQGAPVDAAPSGAALDEEPGEGAGQLGEPFLLQSLPVPLVGVDSDLPPAPPLHPRRALPPLTPAALAALARQDAAAHALHLRLLRFDDQLADLASERALLVRFHVRPLWGRAAQEEELVVEAPQFLTVEYLKRRVARAKLQRGEVLQTSRFVLRKRVESSGATDGAADGAGGASAAAGRCLEDLLSALPGGDEVFLAALGYQAPGPYELFIASAPQTTDLEQQEAMLADLEPPPRPQQAWAAGAAAAAAAAGSGSGVRATAARSAAVAAARHSFQALLQQSPGAAQQEQGEQQQAQSSAGGTVDMRGTAAVAAAAAAASPAWPARRAPTLPFESAAQPRRAAAAAAGSDDLWQHEPPRRSSGGGGHKSRWGSDEVSALIEGVALHGHSWARIHAEHVYGTRRIASHRGQVDLKDKWRNLVKRVGLPAQRARGADLTGDQLEAIREIVGGGGEDPLG
ncbi:Ribulose bisphosphate carboxylase oxygenase chloroplastic [Micractinium conductrix]|uniref:Ribulose bisphosphate carboxylase oxygenase chloroplastic n=1 Tax=Micractinium conductrix TaxID=554055 RepID=A0A2P6VJF0_9CHLO|nr:Ribulose bisphosphate carboxylase oxygenase chloroplastic [Micractinium conductrix]|eukprot:PSC74212.1 Ribulose bisphosphate carboxylase oxygenase chloroplastic [Micractinium conductrix]